MRDTTLMQMALGLTPPWIVTGSDFDAAAGRIDIQIDFPAGSRFTCPACGAADCPVHDTEQKSWRHLNFFQHQAYLNARVPHYVDAARARLNAADVTRVAIDETAAQRGHNDITLCVDIDQARVLFATEGKDASTVAAFAEDLAAHGGDAQAISEVCIDMSPAFIAGVAASLPAAQITFDKFHAVKIVNEAVDAVRRAEAPGSAAWHTLYLAAQPR